MRRGANSQATIREDVLKKNIANFWANVKLANEKIKFILLRLPPQRKLSDFAKTQK